MVDEFIKDLSNEELFNRYHKFIRHVIYKRFGRGFNHNEDFLEDLIQEGYFILMKAKKNFNFKNKFSTFLGSYLETIIIGIIKNDRNVAIPKFIFELKNVYKKHSENFKKEINYKDFCKILKKEKNYKSEIKLETFNLILKNEKEKSTSESFDGKYGNCGFLDFQRYTETIREDKKELIDKLTKILKRVDELNKIVIIEHFIFGKTIQEISKEIGITRQGVDTRKLKGLKQMKKFAIRENLQVFL